MTAAACCCLEVNSGTRLSPWLAFGCLSARMVIKEASGVKGLRFRAQGLGFLEDTCFCSDVCLALYALVSTGLQHCRLRRV